MSLTPNQGERRFFAQWVLATSAGWLLGFVFIMLGAILADLIGVEDAQFFLGIGMGTGVGYGQLRWAGPRVGATNRWVGASAIGMGAPFIASDIVHAVWTEFSYSLPLAVALGGLLVGFLQRRLLHPHSRRADWWVPACIAGWTLAAATVALGSIFPPGGWLALFSLGAILLRGVVLAVVTGGALVWLLRSAPAV